MDLSNLTPVDVNKRQSSDLRYFKNNDRFIFGPRITNKYDFENLGIEVFRTIDTNNKTVFLFKLVDKEIASVHRGKGEAFNSKGLASSMELTQDTNWDLEEKRFDGDIYLRLIEIEETTPVEEPENNVLEESLPTSF